jgi:hypothetical protein
LNHRKNRKNALSGSNPAGHSFSETDPLYGDCAGGPPAFDQPQLNLDDPPPEPHDEEDSELFEEEKPERTLSGLPAPQEGHFKGSSPSFVI